LAATDPPERPAGTGSWSRGRGILAAAIAILVVVLSLVLSRLDLANELSVAQSQLTAANEEIAESEEELDQLEEDAQGRSEAVTACRDSAELGEQVRNALETLQRGIDRGDEGTIAQGVARALELQQPWAQANDRCLEATQASDQG
jgi:hypothetical protein